MYLNLAQLYQFTYKGNESKPCVPIITDANSAEAAQNGAPRATVTEVYALIKSDIDLMSFYKLNVFHWHLTDRPSWRIECRCFISWCGIRYSCTYEPRDAELG